MWRQCMVFGWVAFAGAALAWPVQAGNVRDFGAVGDGQTDDTAAIREAVRQTETGLVTFPRGDYRITETIEIDLAETDRLGLDGSGGAGRVIMEGAGPAFRFVGHHRGTASPASVEDATWQRERMPQVQNLEILGRHPEADGLAFAGTMQATVRGILVREVRHGIRLTGRNRNVLIDSVHVYNCSGVGVYFDQVNLHQANVTGSHISVLSSNAMEQSHGFGRDFLNGITLRETRGVVLTGNVLTDAAIGSDEAGGAIELFDCQETIVANNQIFEPRYRGIYVEGGRNALVTANQVMDRSAEPAMLAAIEVRDGARGVVLRDNVTGPGRKGNILAHEGVSISGTAAAVLD